MYRRYTVHRDGDVLVEELDPQGRPLDPEPVPPEERLPVELTVLADESVEARAHLIELLEFALGMETEGPEAEVATVAGYQRKPNPS